LEKGRRDAKKEEAQLGKMPDGRKKQAVSLSEKVLALVENSDDAHWSHT
jgi:hypothetical protein